MQFAEPRSCCTSYIAITYISCATAALFSELHEQLASLEKHAYLHDVLFLCGS